MTLFNEIMNLPTHFTRGEFENVAAYLRYKEGHRDARHAAAVISMKGDRAIDLLKEAAWCCEDEQLKNEIKSFLEEVK